MFIVITPMHLGVMHSIRTLVFFFSGHFSNYFKDQIAIRRR